MTSQAGTGGSPRALAGETADVLPFPLHPRGAEPVIIGCSRLMQHVLDRVARLAPKRVNVMVYGETGTGKELIAGSLHAKSQRASAPLVRVNCGAIPRDLVEAELFGHTRGAFSGANQARPGFFGAADGGTLLLDEVEALPLPAQATILRAVDHGEVQTVGSAMIRRVDVRIIACTNVDLAHEAAAGRFRKDLYYRLAVATISLPALRYRPEDIEPLVRHFVADYASRFGTHPVAIPSSVVRALQAKSWPGNVRELENAVACMVALSEDGVLRMREPSGGDLQGESGFRAQVAEFEERLLLDALARWGTQSAAARGLGLSRTTFLDLLRRHGISGRTAARRADLSPDNIEVE